MGRTYLVGQSSVPLSRPVVCISILGPYLPHSPDVHRGGSGYPRSSEPTGGQESVAGPNLEAPHNLTMIAQVSSQILIDRGDKRGMLDDRSELRVDQPPA